MDSIPKGKLLNLQPQARSCRGYKHTEETKLKMKLAAISIGNSVGQRVKRSQRAKEQHKQGLLKRTYKVKDKKCKVCQNPYTPTRRKNGILSQSKLCLSCRPLIHKGGNYHT
jgi:hypothetical protein